MSISNLRKITNGKTVFYNSAFSGNNELVRTGIDTENSFYHSLLLAYAENYSEKSKEEKNDMVSRFIESLTKKVTEENWEQFNSEHKLVSYDSEILRFLSSFYEYMDNKEVPDVQVVQNVINKLRIGSNFELYEAIFELISFSNFKEALRTTNRNSSSDSSLEDYRDQFISNVIGTLNNSREFKAIDIEKKKYITNIINTFLVSFFKELEKYLYLQFKSILTNTDSRVNPYLVSLISKRFKRDIYFINGSNKLPYSIEREESRDRKSIVLLRIDNLFEPIGKILENKEIGYEFDPSEPFIRKLNTFVLHPENIDRLYPELSQFLPSASRRSKKSPRNLYSSDSESEEERKPSKKPVPKPLPEPEPEQPKSEPQQFPYQTPSRFFREPPTRNRDTPSTRFHFDSPPLTKREEFRNSMKDLIYQSSDDESN